MGGHGSAELTDPPRGFAPGALTLTPALHVGALMQGKARRVPVLGVTAKRVITHMAKGTQLASPYSNARLYSGEGWVPVCVRCRPLPLAGRGVAGPSLCGKAASVHIGMS